MQFAKDLISWIALCALFPAAFAAQSAGPIIDGLWLTDGYGQLLEIRGNSLRIYELTDVSCIPAESARRRANSKPGESVFAGSPGVLRISAAESPDRLWLHVDGSVSSIQLKSTPAFPGTCSDKVPNSPQANYQIFWQTFSENYPFFAVRHMDWADVDRRFRPHVTEKTSPADLFKMFQQMMEPLADAHTALNARNIHKRFEGLRLDAKPLRPNLAAGANEIIRHKYLIGKLKNYCHQLVLGSRPTSFLHFGLLNDSIGYLRIDAFPEHCEAALDSVFAAAAELKGLVIDVRRNAGGSDVFGIEIASRLTNRDYVAYSKVTRNDARDEGHRTLPQPVLVSPVNVRQGKRSGFMGPVVLLTGPESVSAAEVFAMALFEREPRVIRIGANTQGVFSDVLERRLPNGWRFILPNEIYLTRDGSSFDATGVAPDIAVPVFPDSDLQSGRDGALQKAIEILGHPK